MKAARQSTVQVFGEFQIDAGERILMRGDTPIVLPPKAFDVLLALVESRGQLVDRQWLLNRVWPDATVEENSLSRAIADIRKALGERARENRYIVTVSKHGYRFVAEVTRSEASIKTLAVLPFVWLTSNGGDGVLSVGLADALIARLSNLAEIIVRPTSAVLKYADSPQDPASVAAELDVDFLISGSIQQVEDRVRVTVQMVSPSLQRSIWADQFEETFTHVFAVEDSISSRIAAALALKLTSAERESLARPNTENHEAYQLYLRGRCFWSRQTLGAAQQSILLFSQAVELDPGYALAWAGIADARILIGLSGALTGGVAPHQLYPEAKQAALKAIEINEGLAEAHASLGFIKMFYDWDRRGAHESFRRALYLRPSYPNAHHGSALTFGFYGEFDAAIDAIDAALATDSHSPILNANKGYLLYVAGRHEESVAQLRKAIDTAPGFAPSHYRLGLVHAMQNRYEQAIEHLEEAQRLSGNSPFVLGSLGYVFAKFGKEPAARAILQQLTERASEQYVSATLMAEVSTGLGEFDDALAWLDLALRERSSALFTFNVDPRYDCLRSMPEFRRIVEHLHRAL